MTLQDLLQCLDKVESIEEETHDLFSQPPSTGSNLGFVSPAAPVVHLTVAGRDLTIHQSPSVLSSSRPGGTTGAVLWKITPLFASWLSRPDNPLFSYAVLGPSSSVLELGCGIAAVVGLVLSPRVGSYLLTDQPYVSKLVETNLLDNRPAVKPHRKGKTATNLTFAPLDWETDAVTPGLGTFDAVLACDCVYNEALVEPFVSTCVDICRLRGTDERPCVVVFGQHLRDADVFEVFMDRFGRDFDVWRVPDARLVEGLRAADGFSVHVGALKGAMDGTGWVR